MSDQKPDFSERLKAMREGRGGAAPQQPSLKDRLNKGAPPEVRHGGNDVKSRIQARFSQKVLPSVPTPGAVEPPPEVLLETPQEFLPEFEYTNLPEEGPRKEEVSDSWTAEHGGICPQCRAYNLGHVAFCGECSYMLVRSEQVIEVTTSYPISEIRGLVKAFVDKLKKLNIHSTQDMLRVGVSHKNRQMLIKHTGMSERSLLRLVHHSDFCRVPSMTPETAALLELLGINSLADLLKLKPSELYNKIHQNKIKLNQSHIIFLPTKNQVGTWLEEAAELTPLRII